MNGVYQSFHLNFWEETFPVRHLDTLCRARLESNNPLNLMSYMGKSVVVWGMFVITAVFFQPISITGRGLAILLLEDRARIEQVQDVMNSMKNEVFFVTMVMLLPWYLFIGFFSRDAIRGDNPTVLLARRQVGVVRNEAQGEQAQIQRAIALSLADHSVGGPDPFTIMRQGQNQEFIEMLQQDHARQLQEKEAELTAVRLSHNLSNKRVKELETDLTESRSKADGFRRLGEDMARYFKGKNNKPYTVTQRDYERYFPQPKID